MLGSVVWLILACVIAGALVIVIWAAVREAGPTNIPAPSPATVQVELGGRMHELELALTDAARAEGLKGRPSLPDHRGMLFAFADEATRRFWMKDCLIPLDIIFMDATGTIVSMHTLSVPTPGTPDAALPTCTSASPAKYVIELNAGRSAELGLNPGHTLDLPVELLKSHVR